MAPDEFTNEEILLDVGDGHQLYVWDWGNPKAKIPFIYFHGGPGSGTRNRHRETFDPKKHRVIFYDQRGSGCSLPGGSLVNNTTKDLLQDVNKILDHLKIKKVNLVGASWGSTMAMAYAIENPERVNAVVVSAIFLGSQEEIDWVDKGSFKLFYPEVWEKYLSRTPKAHHHNPTQYHFEQMLGNDPEKVLDSAIAVEEMEHSLMCLDDRSYPIDRETFDPTSARMYAHYMKHRCFMPDKHILKNAHKITTPVWIVQGRYDMDCPPHTAYALHKAIPQSELYMTIGSHRAEHETWNILRSIIRRVEN